jgi:hypothetical protein
MNSIDKFTHLDKPDVIEKSSSSSTLPLKKKSRGKSSTIKRYLRKQANIIDGKRELIKAKILKKETDRIKKSKEKYSPTFVQSKLPLSLSRFNKK